MSLRARSSEKRGISKGDIARIRRALQTDAVIVSPNAHVEVIRDDPDDDRILECALDGGADYVVSGDHYLLELRRYRAIRMVTPREFLAILEEHNDEK